MLTPFHDLVGYVYSITLFVPYSEFPEERSRAQFDIGNYPLDKSASLTILSRVKQRFLDIVGERFAPIPEYEHYHFYSGSGFHSLFSNVRDTTHHTPHTV